MTRNRPRHERGTAALEFVVLVPIVVLVALFVLQIGVAAWTASQTQEAARQSARAHSLGRDPLTAAENALPGALHVDDIDVSGDTVRVSVDVPRVSPLPVFTVHRQVSMPELP